jgi:hypothetical protein
MNEVNTWFDVAYRGILIILTGVSGLWVINKLWLNNNYVTREYFDREIAKMRDLHAEFALFKAEYKGDARLQNEQMKNMSELLKAISEQVKSVNNKLT